MSDDETRGVPLYITPEPSVATHRCIPIARIAELEARPNREALALAIEKRGAEACAARQGHGADCGAYYLSRGKRCHDCPADHYDEAAEIARKDGAQ